MELLQEKERRMLEDPLKYAKRHIKQFEFQSNGSSIRVLFWGNRVGKTEGCAEEVADYATGGKGYDVKVYKFHDQYEVKTLPKKNIDLPIEIWCACPSYDVQKDTTQKKLERYLPKKLIKHITYIKAGTWGEVELIDGTRLNFKSYEQGREKFQGSGKRLIWFDEEPPKDIWEECIVRQEAGQPLDIIMSMTPVKGMTWVYDDLFMKLGQKDLFISLASWDDNPWLTDRQKQLMASNLSDEAIQVRKYGKFVKRVGLVCNWWDRGKNLMEYTETNPEWDYYEVLDGGFSDPAAWLLIGVNKDGDINVIDGFRERGLSDAEIVSRRDNKTKGVRLISGWIDYNDVRLQENLSKLGMYLRPVKKKVGDTQGWDEIIAERLAEYGKVQRGTGKPRLFINPELTWLIQEIENLTWLEIKRQVGGEIQIMPKWDDHRRYGHHFDGLRALGYFVVSFNQDNDEIIEEPEWAGITPSWAK